MKLPMHLFVMTDLETSSRRMLTCSSSSQSLPLGQRHSCHSSSIPCAVTKNLSDSIYSAANRLVIVVTSYYPQPTTLTVWHDVDLPAEVGDGPGEVVVDVVLLVSVAPAGRLYRRLPHELLLGGVRTAALRHPPPAVMSIGYKLDQICLKYKQKLFKCT